MITSVLEFALLALNSKGKVIISDAPQTDLSFDKILELVNANRLKKMGRARGIPVGILDLRDDEWTTRDGVIVKRRKLPGDPKGSVVVDLKDKSAFLGKAVPPLGYYGADYESGETTWAHSGGRNIYKVSRSVIEADLFINLPKLKTHKMAGITVCMKNLVGITTYKNYLPHHSVGTPPQGGDEFPVSSRKVAIERAISSRLRKLWTKFPNLTKFFVPAKAIGLKIFGDSSEVVRGGSWYGNDTLWRMIIGLNRILLYSNSDGSMRKGRLGNTKRYLAVADGIVAGEGMGPSAPERVNAGILIAGTNPLATNTGGSTGRPLEFYWQRGRTRSLERAFMWRQWSWAGFKYGDKTCVIRGQTVKEGLWHYDPIDKHLFVNSYNLSDSNCQLIVKKLREFKPVSIQAYPSTLTILAG